MIALTLDDWQKIVQICFWIVSGTVVVLTYLKARKSLLSTVNSEYQKRVMDRLQKLSEQLYEEFELDSDEHWSKDPIRTGIEDINETFENNREDVLAAGEWIFGTPYPPDVRRLDRMLAPLKSDPFVPAEIRELVVDLVENRLHVMRRIYHDVFDKYTRDLAKGRKAPVNDLDGLNEIHNSVVGKLNKQGCGISQIQEEVHEIREAIRRYFESFDPR